MKIKRNPRQARMTLILRPYDSYIDDLRRLESLLRKKPARLHIEMFGAGEIPAGAALLLRSALRERSPRTRIVTSARTHLRGGSVLLWLMGDTRLIQREARLYFRAAGPFGTAKNGGQNWSDRDFFYGEDELDQNDYVRILEGINEYLDVREMAGRPIEVDELKEFGLVDNEKVDQFLASAFRRKKAVRDRTRAPAKRKSVKAANR